MGFGRRIGSTLAVPGRGVRRAIVVAVVVVAAAGVGGTVALSAPALLARVNPQPVPLPVAPRLVLGPLAASAPSPTRAALTTTLTTPLAAIPGTATGTVIDPATGDALWDHDADRPLVPGSTAKLVTTAAALLTLNPTDTLVTKVVAGPDPDTVVLVGGGDPTLTALPDGKQGVYQDPARLVDLAKAVTASTKGAPIHRVLVDTSRYAGPTLAPGWDVADIAGGNWTPIESLMLDGGRLDPTQQDGARTDKPALVAGKAFATLLGVDPDAVSEATAAPGAVQLGAVTSAPVAELVENTLRASDNVLAEALARQVAIRRGGEASFAGAAEETVAALTQAGIDASGVSMVDGSGLSTKDRVTATTLGSLLAIAAAPAKSPHDVQFLRPILTGLPVAGGDGTLDDRFSDQGAAAVGRGVVRAKTGTLNDVSSLAGIVTDADGRLLVFAVLSNGALPSAIRPKLDDFAATLSRCGCR